jgi:glycosyltransferase involved in cell wall biosynthesis
MDGASWELLLVDNASDQPLESKWDLSWHAKGRHVREAKLGLAWARYRGIRESIGDILIFVDDDNVISKEYVARSLEIARSWPILGAWGAGTIVPEFEVQPAEHLADHLPTLALRRLSAPRWTNVLPCIEATPWGAGLCVRRSVAEAFCRLGDEAKILITGRIGSVLLAGEDVELCFVAASLGLGVGTFPELQLTHLIPRERTSEGYLVRLREGIEIANLLLEHKWLGRHPRSAFSAKSLLGLAKNILVARGLQRRMYFAYWRAAIRAKKMLDHA